MIKKIWYYVYTLRYPDNTVFYIGKGKDTRINQHERVALTLEEISLKSAKIIQTHLNGEKIIKQYEAYFRIEQHSYVYEAMLIETYGLDNLTNKNKGTSKRKLNIYDKAELKINVIEKYNLKHICRLLNITLKELSYKSNISPYRIVNNLIIKNKLEYVIYSVLESKYKANGCSIDVSFEIIDFNWR